MGSKRRAAREREKIGALHPLLALKLAARSLRREPGSALAAVLTLALGVAAASTIYAVLHGFTRPLPVPEGSRVVQIQLRGERGGGVLAPSGDALSTWASAPALAAVGAFRVLTVQVGNEGASPIRADAAELSQEVLPLLGVRPSRGRLPRATPVGDPVEVALSPRAATALFGARVQPLGHMLRLGDRPAIVVGELPRGFGFPYRQSLWWVSSELGREGGAAGAAAPADLELVGRLAPGASPSAASEQLTARVDRARAQRAPGSEPVRAIVKGFTQDRGESGERVALMALLGLVLLLVLVSTTNVANLLLTRATERARLLTVHAALGAGPGQVALQLLGEAALLCLAGAALGLGGGSLAVGFIQRTLAANWGYFWMRVAVDGSVVLFTFVLAVALALAAGAAPATTARRADLAGALRGLAPGAGRRSSPGSVALLTGQVAFSTAALVLALIMAFGVVTLARSGAALPRSQVVLGSVTLDSARYPTEADRADLRRRLLTALRGLGARDAVLTTGVPGFRAEQATLEMEGSRLPASARGGGVAVFGVTPSFFDAFGMSVLIGRFLREGDANPHDPAAVLSADLAREAFGGASPVGRRIRLANGAAAGPWYRVVGVATGPFHDAERRAWVYVPIETRDPSTFFVALRAARGSGLALAPAVRRAVRSADADLSLDESMVGTPLYTLGGVLDYVARFYRISGLLAALGATGALLVALLGVHGVLALDLRRRVREMGVRMALGASRISVAGRIVRRGLLLVSPGVAAGLALAWLAAPVFRLFAGSLDPRDPRLMLGAAAAYLVAALATAAPTALRAARVEPARVLRDEA